MSRYVVNVFVVFSDEVEVEANSEKETVAKALDCCQPSWDYIQDIYVGIYDDD